MNPKAFHGRSTRAPAQRLPVAARVAAGLGAAAVTAICLGSQLVLVAVYSGEADAALAQMRPSRVSGQMAAHAPPHVDADVPQRLAQ